MSNSIHTGFPLLLVTASRFSRPGRQTDSASKLLNTKMLQNTNKHRYQVLKKDSACNNKKHILNTDEHGHTETQMNRDSNSK